MIWNIRFVVLLAALVLESSCSIIADFVTPPPSRKTLFSDYRIYALQDYQDQLSFLGHLYLASPSVKKIKLTPDDSRYLESLYNKLTIDNELLFEKKIKPRFFIVDDAKPFYFSLPEAQFFLSRGLIKKYLIHEDLLLSVLAAEIVRVHYSAYKKNIIVPVGYIGTERLLSLVKLDLDEKSEINKWSYYAMKRSGYDPAAYLNWLQLQNKNTLDFLFQMGGDLRRISKEEHLLKKFMVTGNLQAEEAKKYQKNSSKEFYKFITSINNR